MKLKDKDSETTRYDLRELAKLPPGPARLTRLLSLLDQDIAQYPMDTSPPPEVAKAHAAYLSATSVARQTVEGVETAKEAAGTAAGADLSDAMQAIQAGKITPKSTTQPKAADAIAAAITFTTAAENLVGEAQAHLVDAIQESWPTWRVEIVRAAAAARVKAAEATAAAAAAVATHRALFAAVGQLDNGVLSRDAELSQAVRAETRQGIGWYGSGGGAPLRNVLIPGVKYRGDPMPLDLAVVVETVAAAVAEAGNVQASDWVPPTDPRHADLLAQPLDPDQLWVRSAIRRKYGDVCVVCKRPGTEEAVEVNDAIGPWGMVHTRCKNQAPDAKAQKHAERQAKMQREGYPPSPNEATQIVGPSGRVHKDKDFSG